MLTNSFYIKSLQFIEYLLFPTTDAFIYLC